MGALSDPQHTHQDILESPPPPGRGMQGVVGGVGGCRGLQGCRGVQGAGEIGQKR